ncbi:hypothetical protein MIR68_005537 [Amoeboaphelidium protococcarum]|nr:hypothetical protein MIR68_005537 [Amoeboaphelidium protococcarum]
MGIIELVRRLYYYYKFKLVQSHGIFLRLDKLVKFLLHKVTGQSELERLLLTTSDYSSTSEDIQAESTQSILYVRKLDSITIVRLYQSWMLSQQLMALRVQAEDSLSSIQDLSQILAKILNVKKCSHLNYNRKVALQRFMVCYKAIILFTGQIRSEMNVKVDASNGDHEQLLKSLFITLTPPGIEYQAVTPYWERLGFQQKDPTTDFRALGLFALRNLSLLAVRFPQMCSQSLALTRGGDINNYLPWACHVINFTSCLVELLKSRQASHLFIEAMFSHNDIDTSVIEDGIVIDVAQSVFITILMYILQDFDQYFYAFTAMQRSVLNDGDSMPIISMYPSAVKVYKNHFEYRLQCVWNPHEWITYNGILNALNINS